MTPRTGEETYGDEVEISAEILDSGLKKMKKSIDSTDFEIGVYTYGDVSLKVINKDGLYNPPTDYRSIFPYSRNLAKIRIAYTDSDGEYTRFRGLVNEEATKQDFIKEEVEFRVLSLDSVLRTTKISGGLIPNGTLASAAIKLILNQTQITRVLDYDPVNINVDQDFMIDDGSYFDNKEARKALNEILFMANSVLILNTGETVFVNSRSEEDGDIANLYGPFDEKNRQNVIDVKNYNLGLHRAFTSVKIGDSESTDQAYVLDYGYRQLSKSASFITSPTTQLQIGNRILQEFKDPQIELEVTVPTYIAKNLDLLDKVSINYPLRIKKSEGKFLPVVGQAVIDDDMTPLPATYGGAYIKPEMGFKIIEISEDAKNFETTLKLRQYGWLTDPTSSIVGYAVVGESLIAS
jgi:hypothetical protein